MAAAQATRTVRNLEGSVSYAQWAMIARQFCAIAGIDMPANRGQASDMIQRLMAQAETIAAKATDVPF